MFGEAPLGAWIREADPFHEGAEQLATGHPDTQVFAVLPGGHDGTVLEAVGSGTVRHFAGLLSEHTRPTGHSTYQIFRRSRSGDVRNRCA